MPFDGLDAVNGLARLVTFFSDQDHWYQEEYCRRRGAHRYEGGRMCLAGAVENLSGREAAHEVRTYIEGAIFRVTGRPHTLEGFNQSATHHRLMMVLRQAHTQALRSYARRAMAFPSGTPTPKDAPIEVFLLDDLISFYENPEARPGPRRGVSLSRAIHHFRTARSARGDRTMKYLRRAFRGVAWTFGSVRAFDSVATREVMLGALRSAREMAITEMTPAAPAVLKLAA